MGLLGLGVPKGAQTQTPPATFADLSAAVDALTSPRRVMKATLPEEQRAHDV